MDNICEWKNKRIYLDLPDMILFVDSEMDAQGEEQRIIRTDQSMYWEAGIRDNPENPVNLPAEIPLDYKIFSGYFNGANAQK